jgi:secreted PhoX family phosphatase
MPTALWFDPRGLLWIQADVSTRVLNRGPYAKVGNNQILAADLTRPFLPHRACELRSHRGG